MRRIFDSQSEIEIVASTQAITAASRSVDPKPSQHRLARKTSQTQFPNQASNAPPRVTCVGFRGAATSSSSACVWLLPCVSIWPWLPPTPFFLVAAFPFAALAFVFAAARFVFVLGEGAFALASPARRALEKCFCIGSK